MNRRVPAPWIRRSEQFTVEMWFPFEPDLVEAFKSLIPWQQRTWGKPETGHQERAWIVRGEPWATQAEEWFVANCGRGREIARGQTELAL